MPLQGGKKDVGQTVHRQRAFRSLTEGEEMVLGLPEKVRELHMTSG